MFDNINVKKTMDVFSSYNFKFGDDIEETDDEDHMYDQYLYKEDSDKSTKLKIDIFAKKEPKATTKKTKKAVKRSDKTIMNDSSVANSIVQNIIHIDNDIFD